MDARASWCRSAILSTMMLVPSGAFAGFTNGGFENGDFTGWTKSSFLTSGLTGNQPYSSNSITRNSGGSTAESVIVTGTTMTGIDAQLTSAATLRYPEFGSYTARVNGNMSSNHSNTITQQATMIVSDIDPEDGKVHVRFAFAPVLQNPGHPDSQQPYVYIGVRNVSRSNSILYEFMVFAGQTGVPWKTANSVNYTDWQTVDIAPGNSQLAVGDTVSVEVTAAGCSQGGHYAYVYFDAFGTELIPGLSVAAAADKTIVSAGDSLTYTLTYRNAGEVAVNNVIVSETVPSSTTFVSLSDPAHCSQAGGVVTCNFGTMAPGESGTFQVATVVAALAPGAGGYINNGTYSIRGDGVTLTLGSLVAVPVQGAATDLGVTQSVSPAVVVSGGNFTYTVVVTNHGPASAQNVSLADDLPAGLTLVSATPTQGICTGNPSITCSLGTIAYPGSATVTIVAQATSIGVVSSSVSVSASSTESSAANNSTTTVSECTAPPAAPVGLAGTAQGASSITWTWNAISTATGYRFYPSTGGAAIAVGGTSLTQNRLSTNAAYGARISGVFAGGEGALSAYATAYTLASVPLSAAYTGGDYDRVTANWAANGNPAGTLYTAILSTGASPATNGYAGNISSETRNISASFAGLNPSTVYYGAVNAQNFSGAPTAYAALPSTVTAAAPVAPPAPVLSGYAVSSTTIRWSWTPSTGTMAATYRLFSATSTVSPDLASGASFYLEGGLSEIILYSRYLRALNSAGEACSSTQSVSIPFSTSTVLGGANASALLSDPRTGLAALEIPAGASTHTMRWLVSDDPQRQPLVDETRSLLARALAPTGMTGSTESIREFIVTIDDVRYRGGFGQSVMVSVPYPDEQNRGIVDGTGVPADTLQLYVLDETSALWQLVPGSTVDKVNRVVRGPAPHLSIYTTFGLPAATNAAPGLSRAKVFPNPWRPGSGGDFDAPVVVFTNLTAEATVRLYTLSGSLVRRLDKSDSLNQATWDGRNDAGSRVASGVYYYLITGPSGETIKGRLAVLR